MVKLPTTPAVEALGQLMHDLEHAALRKAQAYRDIQDILRRAREEGFDPSALADAVNYRLEARRDPEQEEHDAMVKLYREKAGDISEIEQTDGEQ